MKKILLLLVSGLLIACMAGSAMAESALILDEDGNSVTGKTIDVPLNTPINLNYKITYDGTASSLPKYATYTAFAVAMSPGADITGVNIVTPEGFTLPYTGSKNSEFTDPKPVVVTLDSSIVQVDDKFKIVIGSQQLYVQANTDIVAVPEFPTIAAGMGTIIGLLFIFGRKKEEM